MNGRIPIDTSSHSMLKGGGGFSFFLRLTFREHTMKIKQRLKKKLKQTGGSRPPKEWEKDPKVWIKESKALTRVYRIQRLIWNNFGFNKEKK